MKTLEPLIDERFDASKEIPASTVPFSREVRKLCEDNACGNFGKSWTCPPAIGPLENLQEKLSPFSRFIVIYKVYTMKDSFDWEGMVNGHKDFQSRIIGLKKAITESFPDLSFVVLGAGTCTLCKTCTYTLDEPCRNPEDAMVSVEACGIDAMKMMGDNGLKYNNGPNTVTYIGGIYY